MKRLAMLAFALGWAGLGAAQTCEPTEETHAVAILGTDGSGELNRYIPPEIHGEHNFSQTLPNGWEFILSRAEPGWQVHVFAEGVDLTTGTPPRHGPSPREIYGWHFRNADNTGPNTGEVNAPQEMRAFVVAPDLAGLETTGDGIGWLKVRDYGLSDLAPGETARMTWLEFEACVSWPKTEAEIRAEADAQSPDYLPQEEEIFAACGLDLATYALDAQILPRTLGGDVDGDGSLDEVAQIRRRQDGARGLALCRAGTWLDMAGIAGELAGLPPGYIAQTEAWHWIGEGDTLPPSLGGVTLPDADGGVLILERVEKQAVAIYWKDAGLRAEELFHLVTE
jgi:hypothetical protein